MSCVISTHVSHLHIRVIFGSLYQIRFHFQAVQTKKDCNSDNFHYNYKLPAQNVHLGSHHFHKRIRLCLAIGRFQTEKQLFDACQITHQRFFDTLLTCPKAKSNESSCKNVLVSMRLHKWAETLIKRRQDTGSHIYIIRYLLHFNPLLRRYSILRYISIKSFIVIFFFIELAKYKFSCELTMTYTLH